MSPFITEVLHIVGNELCTLKKAVIGVSSRNKGDF